jgi:hypothetical protein
MQDNQELLEGTLTELFEFGGECASLVGQIVGDLGNSLTEWWDSNGSSAFGNIVDAWNDIKKTVLELWNDCDASTESCQGSVARTMGRKPQTTMG